MDPQLLQGVLARERMVDAIDRVESAVSYLRADLSNSGPYVGVGELPEDGVWIRCDELVRDPDWLKAVIVESGRRLGTEDPVVAASLFVQNYSYRVLALAVSCLLTSGVIPDSSASSMAITLARGRPSRIGYLTPSAMVVSEPGSAVIAALRRPDASADAFKFIISCGFEQHIAVLIDSTRARIRVGRRLLWGNVAASSAVAFRTMEGCLGQWVQPLGERFFQICPVELQGLGSFLALELERRRGWYWERTNCCLYDRLPGNIRCSDCSRTPTHERRSAYLASLQG